MRSERTRRAIRLGFRNDEEILDLLRPGAASPASELRPSHRGATAHRPPARVAMTGPELVGTGSPLLPE